jgi:peptidoglycan/LPS O-acetylase OafA/YrhL
MTTTSPSAPKFADTTASALLDMVRGLAAVLVLVEHWRNLLLVDFPQLHVTGLARWVWGAVYVATSAGHQAVVIFFVLSGYLISGSIFRTLERGRWSWGMYAVHRLARLWVVLLPGLVLCALWDWVGLHAGRAPLTYAGLAANHMTGNVAAALTVRKFFGNLFFLSPMVVPVFGSDGPLWSLPYEFWYYVMFPLAVVALSSKFSVVTRGGNALCLLAAAWFVRGDVLWLFPIWLLGVLLLKAPAPRVGAAARWVAAVLYVPAMFWFAKLRGGSGMLHDYAFGALTFLLFWVLLSARERASERAAWVVGGRGLSRFSYTLYVCHMPLLLLIAAFLAGDVRWQPTAGRVLECVAVLGVALGYAWAVAWLTEFRTDKVRRWAEVRLLGQGEGKSAHERVLERKTP